MKREQNHEIASSRRTPRTWRWAVGLLFLAVLLGGLVPLASALTIATPVVPTDTAVSYDGSMSFVLCSGNSTLLVIDPPTGAVLSTIPLGVPVGVAADIDWDRLNQRVLVGCTNGMALSADPVLGGVVTLINNPAASYGCVCADNLGTGALGWGIDTTTGMLDQFLPAGLWIPAGFMPLGTYAEVVEKATDPAAPTPQDGYILAVGTSGAGFVNAMAYDRTTMLMTPIAIWGLAPRTATGITSSTTSSDAYVTAMLGMTGDLLQLNLVTMIFGPGPIGTFTSGPPMDVAMVGQFLTVVVPTNPGPGTELHIYDAGDPTNILYTGYAVVDPANSVAGSLSAWISSDGSLDDIYTIYTNTSPSAGSEWVQDHDASWVDPSASTVVSWLYADTTSGLAGYSFQSHLPCTDCPPQETGRGLLEGPFPFAATEYSVQFASGEEVKTLPILSVPGVGIDLEIYLTYRSRRHFDGRYGQSWFLNQDVKLETEANGDETYHNGYGRLDTYTNLGGGAFAAPPHYDTMFVRVGAQTQITDRFGTVSTYDGQGRRTSVQDRYGNTITYTWNADQLTSIRDTLSRTYTLSYDATGRLSSVTDFGGRVWTISYDYLGQLRTLTTPATTAFASGRVYRFSYSGNHATNALRSNLIHAWSPKGDIVQTLGYDSNDMVIREAIGGDAYGLSYDSALRMTTVTDRSSNVVEWTFGAFDMPTKVEAYTSGLRAGEPGSYVTTFSINATTGVIDYQVYPRGNRADYTYECARPSLGRGDGHDLT